MSLGSVDITETGQTMPHLRDEYLLLMTKSLFSSVDHWGGVLEAFIHFLNQTPLLYAHERPSGRLPPKRTFSRKSSSPPMKMDTSGDEQRIISLKTHETCRCLKMCRGCLLGNTRLQKNVSLAFNANLNAFNDF